MKLEDLIKICDAATPGPWKYDWGNHQVESRNSDYNRWPICDLSTQTDLMGFDNIAINYHSNGEFIAQFNPTVVAALVRECLAARAMRDMLLVDRNDATIQPYDQIRKITDVVLK